MFVAQSRFAVANGMENEVREAFINRPHLVDGVDGFIRMEVLSPEKEPNVFVLMTYWQNKETWKEWFKGHNYKASHKQIPRGVKLVPQSRKMDYFHLISE